MKLTLCTDIHLNFLEIDAITKFSDTVFRAGSDAVLITGDISEADKLSHHLKIFAAIVDKPIYFVLGNHDYWHDGFSQAAEAMGQLSKDNPDIVWLQDRGVVPLTPNTALIGVDGWYDAGYGDWMQGALFMNDWNYIKDFASMKIPGTYGGGRPDMGAIISLCRHKASQDASKAEHFIEKAFETHDHVIFATHVPPWLAVAMHRGKNTEFNVQPYYISRTMGNMLEHVMGKQPAGKTLDVFCGHTHSKAEALIAANLKATCLGAEYGHPAISEILNVL